jgi:hypothetical protein
MSKEEMIAELSLNTEPPLIFHTPWPEGCTEPPPAKDFLGCEPFVFPNAATESKKWLSQVEYLEKAFATPETN